MLLNVAKARLKQLHAIRTYFFHPEALTKVRSSARALDVPATQSLD